MVLIYDDINEEGAAYVRDELLRMRIPCAIGKNERLCTYALVFVVPMDDCAADAAFDEERVIYADFCAINDDSRRKGELLRLISRIEDVLFIKFGFDPYTVVRGAFFDSLDECRYFGSKCFLQCTERLIMRFLAVCGENRVNADVIGAYCLDRKTSAGAVPVHISKINSRLYFYSSIKAINSKKNLGYRLAFI